VANPGALTWYEFACRVAEARRLPTRLVTIVPRPPAAAPRPAYSALGSCRGQLTDDLDTALTRYLEAAEPLAAPAPVQPTGAEAPA
jgi:dTDP-4-dehydrorhamnose reductase